VAPSLGGEEFFKVLLGVPVSLYCGGSPLLSREVMGVGVGVMCSVFWDSCFRFSSAVRDL
jgi:hypothetical protein